MTLNLDAGNGTNGIGNAGQLGPKKPGGLSLGLPLEINTARGSADLVDVDLPLERQGCVLGIYWLAKHSKFVHNSTMSPCRDSRSVENIIPLLPLFRGCRVHLDSNFKPQTLRVKLKELRKSAER